MRFKDLRFKWNDAEELVFDTISENDMEYFLEEIIDGDDYSVKIDTLFSNTIKIVVDLTTIIDLLIDDMLQDDPIYLTDDVADKIIEIQNKNYESYYEDIESLIYSIINKCTVDFVNGALYLEAKDVLYNFSVDDIEWKNN